MNVLILGSGGREHALLWRIAQDESCERVFVWPGNPGMEILPTRVQQKLQFIRGEISEVSLKETIERHEITLVIPGPEKYIYERTADFCEKWGVACFAPLTTGAELERSKLFSKKIMTMAGIPTARYMDLSESFETKDSFVEELEGFDQPVIKISGPSLGKGVFVCESKEEANEILKNLKQTPMAGLEDGLLIEEGLQGREVSFFYACHDLKFAYLGSAQDHKRLKDHDHGPNTGGMGAFSPVPWVDENFIQEVTKSFLEPTLKTMKEMGTPFKGVLFLGLMITAKGPKLLEYNVRFGDPETQALMPLIDGDFTTYLYQISKGQTPDTGLSLKNKFSTHVVKAAGGYPGNFGQEIEKGKRIEMNAFVRTSETQIFFAGIQKDALGYVTHGGRVLGITAWADSLEASRKLVYEKIHTVTFEGEQMRSDIGEKL